MALFRQIMGGFINFRSFFINFFLRQVGFSGSCFGELGLSCLNFGC